MILELKIPNWEVPEGLNELYARALTPEWQKAHHEMGFASPIYDCMAELGLIDEEGEQDDNNTSTV